MMAGKIEGDKPGSQKSKRGAAKAAPRPTMMHLGGIDGVRREAFVDKLRHIAAINTQTKAASSIHWLLVGFICSHARPRL